MAWHRRFRRCGALILVVFLVFVLIVVWVRFHRLEDYTTQAFYVDGKAVRLRVQVPVGWVSKPLTVMSGNLLSRRVDSLEPRGHPDWQPDWLASLLHGPAEPGARIVIWYGRGGVPVQGVRGEIPHPDGTVVYYANRGLGEDYSITYTRTNRAEFEATYRRVVESCRVVR